MQLSIRYRLADQPSDVDVRTNPFSVMAWERRYNTKISRISDEGLGMEDLLYLAWEASKAAQIVVAPFDIWAAAVETIQTVDDDTRPTR